MFSLIVTLVAIALTAALALATLYYGGSSFSRSNADVRAAELLLQGQQLLGAIDLYKADHGKYPSKAELLAPDENGKVYLRSWPQVEIAQAGAVATAYAREQAWQMLDGQPLVWLPGEAAATCGAVNRKTRGDDGILRRLSSAYLHQCWSPADGMYSTVIGRVTDTALLLQVAGDPAKVAEGLVAPISDPSSPLWAVRPSALAGSVSPAPAPSEPASAPSLPPAPALTYTAEVSSGTLAFPSTAVASVSDRRVVYVVNTGTGPVQVYGVYVAGADFSAESTCVGTLAAGQSCGVGVTFAPQLAGTRTGVLTVDTDASTAVAAVALSGQGLQPALGLSPGYVNFGTLAPGSLKQSPVLTLSNPGTAALEPLGMPVLPSGLAYVASTCGTRLEAGASCTFALQLTAPSATSAPGGTLSFGSNGVTAELTYAAVISHGSLDTPTLNFGTVYEGQSQSLTVNVRNDGAQAFTVGVPRIDNAADFSASSSCTLVQPTQSCAVTVTYRPAAGAASRSGVLTIDSDAPNAPFTVNLAGAFSPRLALNGATSPTTGAVSAVTVPSVNTGATAQGTVYFSANAGIATAADLALTGDASFSLVSVARVSATGTATSCGATVTARAASGCATSEAQPSIAVTYQFAPTSAGTKTAALGVTYFDGVGSANAALSLTGTALAQPDVSASTSGSVTLSAVTGQTSASSYDVTLTASGTGPLTFQSVTLDAALADTPQFYIQSNTCPASGGQLAVGQSCVVRVALKPSTTGTFSTSLVAATDAVSGPIRVAISGKGTAPPPAFGYTLLDNQNGQVTLNTSTSPVTLASTNNYNFGYFQLTNQTSGPQTLAYSVVYHSTWYTSNPKQPLIMDRPLLAANWGMTESEVDADFVANMGQPACYSGKTLAPGAACILVANRFASGTCPAMTQSLGPTAITITIARCAPY